MYDELKTNQAAMAGASCLPRKACSGEGKILIDFKSEYEAYSKCLLPGKDLLWMLRCTKLLERLCLVRQEAAQ